MAEHSVKERMRAALGPEVTAHVAALTATIEAVVPVTNSLVERVAFLDAEKARIEDTLSASIAQVFEKANIDGQRISHCIDAVHELEDHRESDSVAIETCTDVLNAHTAILNGSFLQRLRWLLTGR